MTSPFRTVHCNTISIAWAKLNYPKSCITNRNKTTTSISITLSHRQSIQQPPRNVDLPPPTLQPLSINITPTPLRITQQNQTVVHPLFLFNQQSFNIQSSTLLFKSRYYLGKVQLLRSKLSSLSNNNYIHRSTTMKFSTAFVLLSGAPAAMGFQSVGKKNKVIIVYLYRWLLGLFFVL